MAIRRKLSEQRRTQGGDQTELNVPTGDPLPEFAQFGTLCGKIFITLQWHHVKIQKVSQIKDK